jgi:hypothetical protein
MKELDKAIINNDIKHIVFLIKDNNIDCKGAVLIHLKEALVPKYFSAEDLQARGAILTMDALKAAIPEYLKKSSHDYLYETYIKRLYLCLQQVLKAWQQGTMANKDLINDWNDQAIDYLTAQWVKDELPQALKDYAVEKQKSYIAYKYQQWQSKALETNENKVLDEVIYSALNRFWHMSNETTDVVIQQIQDNILEQTVEFYRQDKGDNNFFDEIKNFIYQRVTNQIYDGSINHEMLKNPLEQEKEQILQGKVVPNAIPYYSQALGNLLCKWQAGNLAPNVASAVTDYLKKQLKEYKLPGRLHTTLLEKAIQQLLEQYKHDQLTADVAQVLEQQFEGNIIGYYEKNAEKDTTFRNELALEIFSNLLADWKTQHLAAEASDYLHNHLLADVQKILWDLSFYTSRSAMFLQLKQLQETVDNLNNEITELKQHNGNGNNNNNNPSTTAPIFGSNPVAMNEMQEQRVEIPANSQALSSFGVFKHAEEQNMKTRGVDRNATIAQDDHKFSQVQPHTL